MSLNFNQIFNMKLRLLLFSSVTVFLLMVLSGCSKNGNIVPVPNEDVNANLLNKNAYIVDTVAIASQLNNNNTISLMSSVKEYVVGDIILAPPCKKAPYGFLRKITSRTINAGIISYQTEQASLNEAFEQLNIDATFDGTFDITKKGRQNLLGEGSLTYNFLNNSTIFPGIKINGSARANISNIKFKYQKKKDSLLPSYVLIKVDMNSTGSEIDVSTEGSGAGIKKPEITYADFLLPDFYLRIPIPTPVGIILFPIRCVQKFSLNGGPLTINGKAKWNILPSVNGVLGMEYNNGNWKNLSTFSIDPKAIPLIRGDFNPDLSMNASFILVNPKYEFSPYGADVIKFYAEAPAEITYTGQLQKPQYSLKFNLSVKAGLTSKFWINKEPESPVSIQISEKTLLEGDWPAPIPFSISIFSGNNQENDVNKTLNNPLIVLVRDDKGLPLSGVSVAWNVTSGGGKLANITSVTNSAGQASNSWTIGVTGTQTVVATVKKSDGSNITNSPITFNAVLVTTFISYKLDGIAVKYTTPSFDYFNINDTYYIIGRDSQYTFHIGFKEKPQKGKVYDLVASSDPNKVTGLLIYPKNDNSSNITISSGDLFSNSSGSVTITETEPYLQGNFKLNAFGTYNHYTIRSKSISIISDGLFKVKK